MSEIDVVGPHADQAEAFRVRLLEAEAKRGVMMAEDGTLYFNRSMCPEFETLSDARAAAYDEVRGEFFEAQNAECKVQN